LTEITKSHKLKFPMSDQTLSSTQHRQPAEARRSLMRGHLEKSSSVSVVELAFQLAILLKDCEGCTVITPSLAVASELQYCENLNVVLLGGVIHWGSPDLTGPVTEHCLDLFAVDWVFQGAEGIAEDGSVYNTDLQLAQVDRKMRDKAAKSCLLTDKSKIGQTALVRSGTLADFDVLITECSAPAAFLRKARKMAGEVRLV